MRKSFPRRMMWASPKVRPSGGLRSARSSAVDRVSIDGEDRLGYTGPGQKVLGAAAACRAEELTQLAVAEKPLERLAERPRIARRHEQARLLVDDEVEEAADRRCDDRPRVRHRLGARDAESLAVGR